MSRLRVFTFIVVICASAAAQDIALRGRVDVIHPVRGKARNSADVVVWLVPVTPLASRVSAPPPRLVQKNKRFSPHVVVVRAGTEIQFPNQDPFFHDVFSIYRGKPFDLGLYESGSVKTVRFTQPGVSYIFCNIHPEMSAIVMTLTTPFFALTSPDGSFQIYDLAPGRYKLQVWYEHASDAETASVSRMLDINESSPLVLITLHSIARENKHLNKYGEEYPSSSAETY
jgi:hypothetical protein